MNTAAGGTYIQYGRRFACNGLGNGILLTWPSMTRHPDIRVNLESHNPYALVAAVREQLRLARVSREEIRQFSDEALSQPDPLGIQRVCQEWVEVGG